MSHGPNRLTIAVTLLSFSLSAIPVAPAAAALVPTDELISSHEISTERENVMSFMAREDVQAELSKYGVDQNEAAARVAALSDQEVKKIASRIDELPAGQHHGAAAVAGVALTIFIILLVTDLLCLTSVFNFTRCAR